MNRLTHVQESNSNSVADNDLKMGQLLALLEAMNEPTRRMEGIIMAIYTSIEGPHPRTLSTDP